MKICNRIQCGQLLLSICLAATPAASLAQQGASSELDVTESISGQVTQVTLTPTKAIVTHTFDTPRPGQFARLRVNVKEGITPAFLSKVVLDPVSPLFVASQPTQSAAGRLYPDVLKLTEGDDYDVKIEQLLKKMVGHEVTFIVERPAPKSEPAKNNWAPAPPSNAAPAVPPPPPPPKPEAADDSKPSKTEPSIVTKTYGPGILLGFSKSDPTSNEYVFKMFVVQRNPPPQPDKATSQPVQNQDNTKTPEVEGNHPGATRRLQIEQFSTPLALIKTIRCDELLIEDFKSIVSALKGKTTLPRNELIVGVRSVDRQPPDQLKDVHISFEEDVSQPWQAHLIGPQTAAPKNSVKINMDAWAEISNETLYDWKGVDVHLKTAKEVEYNLGPISLGKGKTGLFPITGAIQFDIEPSQCVVAPDDDVVANKTLPVLKAFVLLSRSTIPPGTLSIACDNGRNPPIQRTISISEVPTAEPVVIAVVPTMPNSSKGVIYNRIAGLVPVRVDTIHGTVLRYFNGRLSTFQFDEGFAGSGGIVTGASMKFDEHCELYVIPKLDTSGQAAKFALKVEKPLTESGQPPSSPQPQQPAKQTLLVAQEPKKDAGPLEAEVFLVSANDIGHLGSFAADGSDVRKLLLAASEMKKPIETAEKELATRQSEWQDLDNGFHRSLVRAPSQLRGAILRELADRVYEKKIEVADKSNQVSQRRFELMHFMQTSAH